MAQTQGDDTCAVVSADGARSALSLLVGRDDVDAALTQECDLFFQTEQEAQRCEGLEPTGGPAVRTGRAFLAGDTVVAVSLYAESLEGVPDQLDRVEDALTS